MGNKVLGTPGSGNPARPLALWLAPGIAQGNDWQRHAAGWSVVQVLQEANTTLKGTKPYRKLDGQ